MREILTCVLQMDNCLCLFSWVWSVEMSFLSEIMLCRRSFETGVELEEVFVPFWKNSARCQNSPRKKGGKRFRIVMSELGSNY